MTRPNRLLVGLLALAMIAPAAAQTVYTWKDAKGVTHYSDSPPPAGAKRKEVKAPEASPPGTAQISSADKPAAKADPQQTEEQKQQQAVADANRAKQRAQSCKDAQANLALLKSSANVTVDKDGDGKADVVLDNTQRQTETANMQAVVTANCSN